MIQNKKNINKILKVQKHCRQNKIMFIDLNLFPRNNGYSKKMIVAEFKLI